MAIFRFISTGTLAIPQLSVSSWIFLILSGLIGYVLGDMFYFASFRYIPYRLSMVIFCTHPIVSTLASHFLFQQSLSPVQFVGVLLTISGTLLALLCAKQPTSSKYIEKRWLGIFYAFLGMLGQGACVLLSSQALELLGEIPGKTLLCSQIRQLAAIVGFTVLGFLHNDWARLRDDLKIPHAIPLLALGGLTGCTIGTTLLLQAIQYIPIGIASALASISPILAIPISILFFKERVGFSEILSICITVAGIILLSL